MSENIEALESYCQSLVKFTDFSKNLTDAYVVEFFMKDHWKNIKLSWQSALENTLKQPQDIAHFLLDKKSEKKYPCVWPLSLLAFRETSRALSFDRTPAKHVTTANIKCGKNMNLQQSLCQSVKMKKQHEIQYLAELISRLCEKTGCYRVVDIGSGQGHLARLLNLQYQMDVTTIDSVPSHACEASLLDSSASIQLEKENGTNTKKVTHITGTIDPGISSADFITLLLNKETPEGSSEVTPPDTRELRVAPFLLVGLHTCADLGPTMLRLFIQSKEAVGLVSVGCCYMKMCEQLRNRMGESGPESPSYPMSICIQKEAEHHLSYEALELACHYMECYNRKLKEKDPSLRTQCFRAILEGLIHKRSPELTQKHTRVHQLKKIMKRITKGPNVSFKSYAKEALEKLELDPMTADEEVESEEKLEQHSMQLLTFNTLRLLCAPVVETLVLLDRLLYLTEQGFDGNLTAIFDPQLSPRNLVISCNK